MNDSIGRILFLAAGMVAGAGVMYLFDPERGKTRQARIRDRTTNLMLHADHAAGSRAREWRKRTASAVRGASMRLRPNSVADSVLADQVRQAARGGTDQLAPLHITVQRGRVTISGAVLADRMQLLIDEIRQLPGVSAVENRLTVYQTTTEMPLSRPAE